jgi:hypothetical protein
MRHAGGVAPPLPVTTLTFGVALAALVAALVLRSRHPPATAASLLRTLLAAIALAAVTV